MKVNVKDGVVVKEINLWLIQTLIKLMILSEKWGYTPTITSLTDGTHQRESYHYKNLAMDLRTSDLPMERQEDYVKDLKEIMGSEYDVVLESDHIHIEPSPESKYVKDKN